ncbi:MAG: hypothetical protein LBQ05_03065 [Christensenellaceae bacterium]|jgi:nitrogen regulatory protein PII|nr:hypothetical protein [Christensenellaceae bacterium]
MKETKNLTTKGKVGEKEVSRQKQITIMEDKPIKYKLLVIITNRGFASEVIEESKLSGCKGATILTGRGASQEHTETFLGVNVTQEKEIVLIVLDETIATATMNGITEKLGINTTAGSMCFLLPVDMLTRFTGNR